MAKDDAEQWQTLAAVMRKTLADNLEVALEVAGEPDGETVKKMKLTELSRATRIARSTITKLVHEQTSKGMQANPDLNTLCRLAAALNLPPAFLLLSANDWQRLLGALNGLSTAFESTCLTENALNATHDNTAIVAVRLAKEMGIYTDHARLPLYPDEAGSRQAEIDQDLEHTNAMKLLAILTTTAVAQSNAKTYQDMATLIAIGAIFGAHFKPL